MFLLQPSYHSIISVLILSCHYVVPLLAFVEDPATAAEAVQQLYDSLFGRMRDYAPMDNEEETTHHKAWMNSGKYQGDIDGIPTSALQALSDPRIFYSAVRSATSRWSDGIVPFTFTGYFTPGEQQRIQSAMNTYHTKTCVRFVPRTNQRDYLNIVKDYGCYSLVGRVGGRQDISLGRGCLYHEIIVHELMHALGFWHEQSRSDRNTFVSVQWHNIVPGLHGQFDKISQQYMDFLSEPYDYYSVMHYDSTAFSRNGRHTIIAVEPSMTSVIGRAKDLSPGDLRKINKLYNCFNHVTLATPPPPNPTTTASAPPTVPTEPVVWATWPSGVGETSQATTTTTDSGVETNQIRKRVVGSTTAAPPPSECSDKFLDCPFFHKYCDRATFREVMIQYCPKSCGKC